MKTSINKYEFRDAFTRMGRQDNFSYEGLSILFDYFEEYEESTGEEIEFDVIAICCEFNEATPEEIAIDYAIDIEDDGNQLNNVLDYLHDHTQVAGVTNEGNIIYAAF
jgi:hypothetical protein